ncbi:MAG: InlB B-repeat-containing protein, partial [Bacteroidales bacterium]|nr:InlB B-repeat-containing protein [Bacteroidales bacterium]
MTTIQIFGLIVVALLGLYVFYCLYDLDKYNNKKDRRNKHRILTMALLIFAMTIGKGAWAQSFIIEASHNDNTNVTTFTITRSGSNLPTQTIKYRTVNLSAYAGQHYTAVSNNYTFPENITTFQVEVSESAQYTTAYAYHYQTGTTRSYRFEVLDVNGFELAHNDRSMTTGAQFSNTYLNNGVTDLVYFNDNGQIQSGSGNKYLDVSYSSSNWTQVTDVGYSQGVHTVSTNSLYNSNSNLRTILTGLSYKMYATVYFTQKEENDGYQYIQIYTGNAGTYDNVDDPDGGIGTLTNSLYRACFILSKSASVMSNEHYQFFPHRYDYVNKAAETTAGITHYEFDYDDSYLYKQKYLSSSYKSSTSGSLVLLPTAENINIRFDAGGGGLHDKDEWDFKNLKVRLALVDETYPTPINIAGITVSAGPYVKGNTFYISVPFSEIVNTAYYSNNKKLVTSWGDATYCSGDGTNVITFKGTINANAGSTLAITSLQCNFKDLAGTFFQGLGNSGYTDSFDKTFNGVTCTESYTLAATNTEFTGLQSEYVVSNTAIEPHPTVYFYKGKKETANEVQLTENTNYTLSWANNNAAGTGSVTATGINSYTGSAGATFPIRWSTYTVSFHGNGSVGIPVTGEMSDQAFQYVVAQSLSANAFSREGFTFAGWNTQPDGSGASYSDGEAVTGLTSEDGGTVDLYAQWTAIPWTGSGDSEEDPYVIMYPSQLDLLASNVNGGNEYNNKFFKLGADITYSYEGLDEDESNYTPIGTGSYKFNGTFDGDNKTISGIRIYTTKDFQGVFKYVGINGTVKNVVLANSIFKGKEYVGGITAWNNGILTNCRIEGSVEILPKDYISLYHGGIVGENLGTVSGCISAAIVDRNDMLNVRNYGGIVGENASTGTVKDCLYTGSTVDAYNYYGAIAGKNEGILTNNYYTTEGIWGVGVGIANPSGNDSDGARRARVITLGDNVAIEGDQTTYDVSGLIAIGTSALSYNDGTSTTIYSGATQDITLSDTAPQGYAVTSYSLNGTPLAGNSFTMPDSDVTVNAIIGVPYIDADGNEQICTDYTLIESSTGSTVILGANETETWYAVSGNVNITVSDDKAIKTYGAVHLILMDGATLTVEGQFPIFTSGSLSIYSQSLGTGSLVASSDGTAIFVDGSLTINGGIITTISSNSHNIYAYDITINGGSVSADGGGINANGALTLGWRNATDRIYASSYYGDNGVVVKSGQYLSDGTAVYSGSLSDTQIDALAGQTLQPVFTLTLPKYVDATSGVLAQEGRIACALADANVTLAAEGCTLADVTVGGEAATDNGDGTWSFIMPAADATVSATVTAIDFTTGHAGTEADPYIIMYRSQLDLLATRVNGGTNYDGKFIKLGADIAYDPNDLDDNGENYTAIGTKVNYRYFKGSFDGDGHIISGIRINKTGQTDADKKQGLFGYVNYAFIKNVVLSDASITGYTQVGGILGDFQSSTTIQNCFVLNLHIIADSNTTNRGVIAGYYYNSGLTLAENYYYNCTVNDASTNVGVNSSDRDGARGVNKLTLCEHVIATPVAAVTYQGNGYYAVSTSVTLSVEEGYTLNGSYTVKDANNNDVALTGGDTFEMPASDVTVNADITVTTMAGSGTENAPWIIMYRSQMDQLAISEINNGEYYQLGRDLTYSYEGLGETESNYTPIRVNAGGHFDGAGHTISGIRVYPYGKKVSCLGLFGINYGSVKNVTLTNAIISGKEYIGGIVGDNNENGLIDNCHVTSTVVIKAIDIRSFYHGGIAGFNAAYGERVPVIRNCTSAATITNNGYENCGDYGGIVGENAGGIISGCTVYEANITATDVAGGIVGYNYYCNQFEELSVVENCVVIACTINSGSAGAIISNSGYATLNHNYYYNCTANGNTTDIGCKYGDITEDDGAVPATAVSRTITGYGDSTESDHWAFIASPMDYVMTPHHVPGLMTTPAEHYDLYRFNQDADLEWQNYKAHTGDFNIENGKGYLYASKE